MTEAKQKTVLLGICGGIAAYKMCDVARQLVRGGYRVKVVMTKHAQEFVGAATFRSLTGNPVATQLFDDPHAPINHISLAQEADVFLIAPATANIIAKLAQGRAGDLLTTTALAYQGPLLVAPAMNTQMYLDPATQTNMALLQARGVEIIGPASGELACGISGAGRMVAVADLRTAVEESVQTSTSLAGTTVLISAGPTQEYFDPVRYLTNRSSGKMGLALARAALRRGAKVVLVLGPVTEAVPVNNRLQRIDVVSTEDMRAAMLQAAPDADLILCAAAVADYKPSETSLAKIKKYSLSASAPEGDAPQRVSIDFSFNPDILAELGQLKAKGVLKDGMTLVGFAAETDNLDKNVQKKLASKGADFIVANDVSRADIGFESDENEARIFSQQGMDELLPKASKIQVAQQILDLVCSSSA
ncbi:MAG: bifunctional phosphopantothenoylcysteine decarboxylase/phosphopantothenate--cysteine ligase CoaBC [Coriobacteriia bacterium]|nr:bifunctional phosphopantothenoylcysteine decarboxylase/phosphopantothenate--cysteine ligase CoaBC [Coriobacteriia bacterium]